MLCERGGSEVELDGCCEEEGWRRSFEDEDGCVGRGADWLDDGCDDEGFVALDDDAVGLR